MILGNDNLVRYYDGLINTRMKICQSDYLRSIGIVLPFTYLSETNQPITLTPAEIIELSWAKLKEDEQ